MPTTPSGAKQPTPGFHCQKTRSRKDPSESSRNFSKARCLVSDREPLQLYICISAFQFTPIFSPSPLFSFLLFTLPASLCVPSHGLSLTLTYYSCLQLLIHFLPWHYNTRRTPLKGGLCAYSLCSEIKIGIRL